MKKYVVLICLILAGSFQAQAQFFDSLYKDFLKYGTVYGVKEETFKAGLDFLCPVELPELKEAIQQAQKSSQF